jgi:hypothetical protein
MSDIDTIVWNPVGHFSESCWAYGLMGCVNIEPGFYAWGVCEPDGRWPAIETGAETIREAARDAAERAMRRIAMGDR